MSKSQGTVEFEEDRLSALPDEVLCHILSLIATTQNAVKTTILSKRWRNLWTLVPNLGFIDVDFRSHSKFESFVCWVLAVRGPSSVRKLKLACMRGSNSQRDIDFLYLMRIYQWISTVIRHNVLVELDLTVEILVDFELPKSLFLCETLEVLKIGPNFVIKELPSSSSGNLFPSLKFLNVSVHHPHNASMEKLFHHFPLRKLEDLVIEGTLRQMKDLNVSISAPKLKRLKIHLRVHKGDLYEHSFYIESPNLESIDLVQDKPIHFIFETSTISLVKAEVYVMGRYSKDRYDRSTALPDGISNVKYLCLGGDCFENIYTCILPTFENVDRLKLRLLECNYGKLLRDWLERFPKLQYLDIEYVHLCHAKLRLPKFVPACVLSHLRTITIWAFEGHRVEMETAKYLLRNCGVLNKMTIDTNHLYYRKKKALYKEFSMFQRGSVNCQVEFVKRE